MTSRTNKSTVTFHKQFILSSLNGPQPAGTYRLVTENEEISGQIAKADAMWKKHRGQLANE